MTETSNFKSGVFYYMSGTGNSFRAAVWAAQELKAKNRTKIIPFEKAALKTARPSPETLTGIFFPTHAFTAPWPAIKFALSMPFSKRAPLFIIATRGGAFYPFPLPGMEGTACLVIALILALKGYDIRGFSGMDMPVNWLAVHWGMNKTHAEYFYAKTQKELSVFIAKLNSGKRSYKSIPSWIAGLLLLQVSFMYVLFARLSLAKIMFADEACNSCGICAEYCPYGAIKMLGGKMKKPYWTFSCESCERCIAYCPKKSIQAGHSYLFLLYWIIYGILGFIPVKIAAAYGIFKTGLPAMALSIAYTLAFAYTGYWLLTLLVKTYPFAWFFSHTTFTKIFRRYNQHATKLKDLKDGTEV